MDEVKIDFLMYVMSLQNEVLIHLGKLQNPFTGQTEINLPLARIQIDILKLLEEKTQGNLTQEEAILLKNALSSLQLNYVEVVKAQGEQSEAPKE
jgi:hypothetical protein